MKLLLISTLSLILSGTTAAQELKTSQLPVFNIYEMKVRQGKNSIYDDVAKKNMIASVNHEQGVLAMYSIKQKDEADIAYMIEIYVDNNANQMHLNSSQYKKFLQHSSELIESDRKRKIATMPQFLGDKKVVQDHETINNFVIIDVKPEFSQKFKDVVIPEMEQSLKVEAGVLAMYAVKDKNNANRWYFYEIYGSKTSYETHLKTPHFQEYITKTAEMISYKEAIAVTPSLLMNKGGLRFKSP